MENLVRNTLTETDSCLSCETSLQHDFRKWKHRRRTPGIARLARSRNRRRDCRPDYGRTDPGTDRQQAVCSRLHPSDENASLSVHGRRSNPTGMGYGKTGRRSHGNLHPRRIFLLGRRPAHSRPTAHRHRSTVTLTTLRLQKR